MICFSSPFFLRVRDSWSVWIALILLPSKKSKAAHFRIPRIPWLVVGGIHLASLFECMWVGWANHFLSVSGRLEGFAHTFLYFLSENEGSVIIPDPTAFVGIVDMRGFRWSSWTMVSGNPSFLEKIYIIKIKNSRCNFFMCKWNFSIWGFCNHMSCSWFWASRFFLDSQTNIVSFEQ